ncbi:MAG: hypothetical protein V7750_18490 [Sneathiella sp.]
MNSLARRGSFFLPVLAVLVCLAGTTYSTAAQAQSKITTPQSPHIFAMPAIGERMRFILAGLASRRFSVAETGLRELISKYPWHFQSHYLLSSLMAVQERKDEAFILLDKAIDLGFSNQSALYKDANFSKIRSDPRFNALAEKLVTKLASTQQSDRPPLVTVQNIRNNVALISQTNTVWDNRYNVLKSAFAFNSRKAARPIVIKGEDAAAKKLNELFQRGLAAGNAGDLYDNRDRQHSALSPKSYPQLAFTKYSHQAISQNTDYGLNSRIMFHANTFGNSSTALNSGPFWRSHVRMAYTMPKGPQALFLQYMNNHLYVYPAVRDFKTKHGDLLPANSPYLIATEGKSGSDRPFLKAIATILAAFKPDVKDILSKTNRLMPTVQMVFRKGLMNVQTKADYLSAKANPAVFRGGNINLLKMIHIANALKAEDIPAIVRLRVLDENKSQDGIDDHVKNLPETLFNTPASIARIIRNSAFEKRILITTEDTKKLNGLPIKYHWVVLQGDPSRIKITPQNKEGNVAEIKVSWHEKFPSPSNAAIKTNRVEIGVFSDNGKELSAPSFVTFLYPGTQHRSYDKTGRLLLVDYRNQKNQYTDPRLFPKRDWRDDFSYDNKGRLTGWIRTRKGSTSEFSRNGAKILAKDNKGRPTKAEMIAYEFKRDKKGQIVITEKPLNKFITYQYQDDKDRLGIIIR